MDWLKPALSRIAVKTPSMVIEESHDAVASDVEYNSAIRQEYANTVNPVYLRVIPFNAFVGDCQAPEHLNEIHFTPN